MLGLNKPSLYFPVSDAVAVIYYTGEFPMSFLTGDSDSVRRCPEGIVIHQKSSQKDTLVKRGHYCAFMYGEYRAFDPETFKSDFIRWIKDGE